MEKLALFSAGIVFLLVAIMHLFRVLLKVEIKINNSAVPAWLSIAGFLFALSLSIWMLKTIK